MPLADSKNLMRIPNTLETGFHFFFPCYLNRIISLVPLNFKGDPVSWGDLSDFIENFHAIDISVT